MKNSAAIQSGFQAEHFLARASRARVHKADALLERFSPVAPGPSTGDHLVGSPASEHRIQVVLGSPAGRARGRTKHRDARRTKCITSGESARGVMGSGNGVLIPLTRDATSENFTAISLTDGRGEARNLRHGVDICLTISGARVLTMSTPWRASYLPDVRDELIAEQNSLEARTGLDPALTRALEEHVMRNGPEVTERERRIVAGLQQGRDFQTKIQLGELYWVTGPMTSLAQEASVTMPPFVVDHEMPCPSGLIAYADGLPPLPHPGGQDGTTRVRLMTWVRTGDRVAVQTYADGTDAPVDARRRWQSVGIGALRWYTVATTDLTVGQEVDEEHLTPTERACVFLLATTWHLMQMPTLAEVRTRQAGSDKKGRRPRGRTPVQLVDLRRLAERNVEADESGRHYTHRFVVRGHWRRQPHGPGRNQIRLQFIEPHIKGPSGAPLLTTREHVNVWRR